MKYLLLLLCILPICVFSQNTRLNGDINVDGYVDAADIISLVNIIMKGSDNRPDVLNQSNEIEIKKVYGDGSTYCAFTSLVKRDGIYYLAFREGITHCYPGDYGVIKIMMSSDSENWNVIQTISLEKVDCRDPNLSVMPNGKLLLLFGARSLREDGVYVTQTYCSIEVEDNTLEEPIKANVPKEVLWDPVSWIWRLTWHKGVGYGVCYGGGLCLMKTTDGYNFEKICDLIIPNEPSECRIQFRDDDSAIMMIRRDANAYKTKGYYGTSEPPYTEWNLKELEIYLAGEDFIIDGERIIVATRMLENIAERTCVWFGNINGEFNWNYVLPYGGGNAVGNTAYAGLLNEKDSYLISYYAMHDEERPSVYLVRIPKNMIPF